MATSKKINKDNILAVVLMAGKGTRMKSESPKVLHKILGKPMGFYVLDALEKTGIKNRLVVTGFGADDVQKAFNKEKCILQKPQLGTGHAVIVALKSITKNFTHLLVVNGDTPLLTTNAVKSVIGLLGKENCRAVVSCDWCADPQRLGRIVTDDKGNFLAIRETSDLKSGEENIEWVNVGLYGFEKQSLEKYLKKITTKNRQHEFYLTDIFGMMVADKQRVEVYEAEDDSFLVMPNTRSDVADAASYLQYRILEGHMNKGITIHDPRRTYIEPDVKIGRDTIIHADAYISGSTIIGKNSEIGPMVTICDSHIGDNVKIRISSIEDSKIDNECVVGPFSHLRPGVHLKKGAKVGNFVEIKKSVIGEDSKVNHLSYIGDATLGKVVNIGAGTITCNFDGTKKHKTFIGDGAFIGSDSILVAPVKIGSGTLTGAGSVITRDIPSGKVAMGVPARVVRTADVKRNADIKRKPDKA
jgi:bifunctional UDP-N-acetylglucosamine pyrophosphorylase/glucosamine-1-phosphate N-acetyltransferase